jgi:hypothetical protein
MRRAFFTLLAWLVVFASAGRLSAAEPGRGITFSVCDVTPAAGPLRLRPSGEAIKGMIGEIEACSCREDSFVWVSVHPLAAAVTRAYSDHRPLVFSPDIVWLAICQGFSTHVSQNAEALRHRIVAHEGKKEIIVDIYDPSFRKGNPHNRWDRVFPIFCDSIRHYLVTDLNPILLPTFTTTTPVETAAFQVTFMDALKSYFNYTARIRCGIPTITLLGTTEDWQRVLDHARALRQFDLDWWLDDLEPVLQQFVAASKGQVDKQFWGSIYSSNMGSVDPIITGWFGTFFPYLRHGDGYERNPFLGPNPPAKGGIGAGELPPSLSRTDLLLIDMRPSPPDSFRMELMAGFVGVKQDRSTLALKPEIAWIVRDDPDKEK